ncbi:MAG: glycosyltransferase family 2 protein [Bacteroidota bacterium]
MKVTGFSFIRNAVICDYPVVEAIKSILPLCDDFVIAVGKSSDHTLELIQNIDPEKIKIIETVWDENLRKGGNVLAIETDKAFQAIQKDTDWCFYIQADEIVHENSLNNISEAMLKWKDDIRVDGLLLNYLHFYGSYQYVADAYNWYRKEIRIIRNNKNIFSYKDAQGFRKSGDQKLNVKQVDAFIHHYGWVKHPAVQQRKQKIFHSLWHEDDWLKKNISKDNQYDYNAIDSLLVFEGTHPSVMTKRVQSQNWNFEFDTSKSKMKMKYRIRRWIEEKFGVSIGEYMNYKLI